MNNEHLNFIMYYKIVHSFHFKMFKLLLQYALKPYTDAIYVFFCFPQVLYTDVTRKHSGTYICMGSNGPGKTAEDSVKVNVLRE
jgi:hypothetical protein